MVGLRSAGGHGPLGPAALRRRRLHIPRTAGGESIDAGLADLATGVTSPASLLVSLAAPRLRRKGVPVGRVAPDPEERLYVLLAESEGGLAHARYNALRQEVVSFALACRGARLDIE